MISRSRPLGQGADPVDLLLDDRPGLPARRQEAERDAVDLRVLGREVAVRSGLVAHPPQAAPDDLLAQELGAEGADAEDVGDGVRVPALGQHGDRHDAADLLAQAVLLADRVHHLAQEVLVGDLVYRAAGEAGPVVGLELVDLGGGDLLERGIHRFARFELRGVDEQRVRTARPEPALDVAEDRQRARDRDGRAVGQGLLPARDPVEDRLADASCSGRPR